IHSFEVPLFSIDNVNWFFESVEERSQKQVFFKKSFRDAVFKASSGFPWLVQQLGFYSLIEAMPDEESNDATIVLDAKNLQRILPQFVKDKLGNDQFDLSQLTATSSELLKTLAASPKGRMSEHELLASLNEQKRPYYEPSILQLKNADLVYEQ